MRNLSTLAMVLLLGCSGAGESGTQNRVGKETLMPNTIMVTGRVHFVGMPCAQFKPGAGCDGPMANYDVVVRSAASGDIVATVKTDDTGSFTAALTEGNYFVQTQNGPMPSDLTKTAFEVRTGEKTELELTVDTGIR